MIDFKAMTRDMYRKCDISTSKKCCWPLLVNRSQESGQNLPCARFVPRGDANFKKPTWFSVGPLKVGTDVKTRDNKRAKTPLLLPFPYLFYACFY